MESKAFDAASLLASMRAELAAFTTLRDVLVAEQAALLASDVEQVQQFSLRKAKLIEQLGEYAGQRADSLDRQGFERSAEGVQAWIALHRGSATLDLPVVWQELLDVARDTRRLNESNGYLVQMRMQHNEGALNAMHSATRRLSLYGPDGQRSYSQANRELGRA